MSGANYEYCLFCDNKAVYVGEDEWPDGVAAVHVKCSQDVLAATVAAARQRIIAIAREKKAVYPGTLEPQTPLQSQLDTAWPFADYLEDMPGEQP